jgi:hypothetical protein
MFSSTIGSIVASVDASFSVPREKALNRPAPIAPGLPIPGLF